MEVTPNNSLDTSMRVNPNAARARTAQVESENLDTAVFSRAQALDQALRATDAVRPDVVNRARQLIADVKYPPIAAIEGISALLALKLDDSKDGSSPQA
jgi:hypothetical protein